jgi:glycosyltransferase involved in cell wall biosynthesis
MKKSALVSIIIPSYNAGKYVQGAVDSALSQTYRNCEVIVVDDGSTDGTRVLLEPYMRGGKIDYLYQKNRGLAAARNAGIKASKGEYIALLDADDRFLSHKIESMVYFLSTHPECSACYHDVYHFREDNPEKLLKSTHKYYSGEDVLLNLVRGNYFIAPSATVFRKKVFEEQGYFDETFPRSEDLEFIVRITSHGLGICFLPEILGKICLRQAGNLQDFRSQPLMKETILKIYEKLYGDLNGEMRRRYKLKYFLGIHRLRAAAAYLGVADKKHAKPYILRSFSQYPLGWLLGLVLWCPISVVPAGVLRSWIVKYHSSRLKSMYPEAAISASG